MAANPAFDNIVAHSSRHAVLQCELAGPGPAGSVTSPSCNATHAEQLGSRFTQQQIMTFYCCWCLRDDNHRRVKVEADLEVVVRDGVAAYWFDVAGQVDVGVGGAGAIG